MHASQTELAHLLTVIESTPVVDNHLHPIYRHVTPLRQLLTECHKDDIDAVGVQRTLAFRRSVKQLASLHGVCPDEDALDAVRRELGAEQLLLKYTTAAGVSAMYVDDGIVSDDGGLSVAEMDAVLTSVGCAVKRVVRVETESEAMLREEKEQLSDMSACEFAARFLHRLLHLDQSDDIVALKSIVAYRQGFAFDGWDSLPQCITMMRTGGAPCSCQSLSKELQELLPRTSQRSWRLANSTVNLVTLFVAILAAIHRDIPLQVHSGFGDADLDLRKADPLAWKPLLEHYPGSHAKIVFLHAAYPYTRNASFLASLYPNVFLDIGLAIPLLSYRGAATMIEEALALAPSTKVLYSSDAHSCADGVFLAATTARRALLHVLKQSMEDGEITLKEAEEIARDILYSNAMRLYAPGKRS